MNHGGPVVGVRVQRSHAVLFRRVALSFAQQGDGTYQSIPRFSPHFCLSFCLEFPLNFSQSRCFAYRRPLQPLVPTEGDAAQRIRRGVHAERSRVSAARVAGEHHAAGGSDGSRIVALQWAAVTVRGLSLLVCCPHPPHPSRPEHVRNEMVQPGRSIIDRETVRRNETQTSATVQGRSLPGVVALLRRPLPFAKRSGEEGHLVRKVPSREALRILCVRLHAQQTAADLPELANSIRLARAESNKPSQTNQTETNA